jgi:hypothetical protein
MKKQQDKCECCGSEISPQQCQLAAYTTTIDGKEVSFCCVKCADKTTNKKTKK